MNGYTHGYLAGCYLKVVFPSRRAARRRARQIRGEGGDLMRPYRCEWCFGIHIGHRDGTASHIRLTRQGPINVKDLAA